MLSDANAVPSIAGRPTMSNILAFLRRGLRTPGSVAVPPPAMPTAAGSQALDGEQAERFGQLLQQAEEVRALAASAGREVLPLGTGSEFTMRFDGKQDAEAFHHALQQLCLMATIYSRLQRD